MRFIAKVDANQKEIVAALRAIGATVQHLHQVGGGCPDLLVGYRGRNYLVEVKSPGGELTPDEKVWQDEWRGDCAVIYSAIQAVLWIREDTEEKDDITRWD